MYFKLLFISCLYLAYGQDCQFNKDTEFPADYPPLLIDLATWKSILPVMDGVDRVVNIAENSEVVVACPGEIITTLSAEVAQGTCSGGLIDIGGTGYDILQLACDARVDDAAVPNLGPCGNGSIGQLASVGFEVTGYPFLEIIQVCFEGSVDYLTLYTLHTIYAASVEASDGNPSRPSFKDGEGFYNYDPNDCYLTDSQDSYFTALLDDPDFIDLNSGNYFSRGHLPPNADFFTEMEADATFYYINVMPQWQDYNGQNWAFLESCARDLADATDTDLSVWTGPHGQQVMNDLNNNPTPLYLCGSQSDSIIPIPELIWKVVYDSDNDNGLAIIQSNVPYETTPADPICPDIGCITISWLGCIFEPTEVSRGYTYCCTVQDLKAVVPHAPDLPTAGLLA